ncbi:radical SAM protein [Pseudoalteromonas xiamenensis]
MVLIDNIEDNISISEINSAKSKLKIALNNGSKTDCDSCPFLEFKKWNKNNCNRITYLSLENHSVCNLKCTYCDEKYYGGVKSKYDLKELFNTNEGIEILEQCTTVVWGGGEPSLGRGFDEALPFITSKSPKAVHRILSNSVKFSNTIDTQLKKDNVKLVTSIDAGNAISFLQIRGKDKFNSVFENLSKYAASSAKNITIKYILRLDNSSIDEINDFIEKLSNYSNLKECNFQISCDFKYETLSTDLVIAAVLLFGFLMRAGYSSVFYDDLLRARLSNIDKKILDEVNDRIELLGLNELLANNSLDEKFIIWGVGWQAKFIMNNTHFFKSNKIEFFVVDKEYKSSDFFLGIPVYEPDAILKCDYPIIIAASQNFESILTKLRILKVDEKRIYKKPIL